MSTEACNKIAELAIEVGKAQLIIDSLEKRNKELEERIKFLETPQAQQMQK